MKSNFVSGNAQLGSKFVIFLSCVNLKFDGWTWKTIGHLFYTTLSFVHHFKAMGVFKLELQYGNAQFGSKSMFFLSCVTFKFDRWHWKTIGHLFYATSSLVHHFVGIGEFKLKLQSGNARLASKSMIFEPCDIEIWRMTLKNNRALLSNIKLCASFHHHMWIQTEVRVRKRLSWLWPLWLSPLTLTFLHFAWTSLLSLVISPENFMMIRWWEHSQKGVTTVPEFLGHHREG